MCPEFKLDETLEILISLSVSTESHLVGLFCCLFPSDGFLGLNPITFVFLDMGGNNNNDIIP